MSKNEVVRRVKVGVVLDHYIDERYIRDRDMVVPLHEGETDADAIRLWCEEMKNWIRQDEKKYVKVMSELEKDEYGGWELYR